MKKDELTGLLEKAAESAMGPIARARALREIDRSLHWPFSFKIDILNKAYNVKNVWNMANLIA